MEDDEALVAAATGGSVPCGDRARACSKPQHWDPIAREALHDCRDWLRKDHAASSTVAWPLAGAGTPPSWPVGRVSFEMAHDSTDDPPMTKATEDEAERSASIIRARTCPAAMGRAMVEMRHKRGMTQRVIARQATLSENHVGKLERGEVLDPGLVSVAKMARALKTSVAPLVLAFAGMRGPAAPAIGRRMEQRALVIAPSPALGAMLRTLRWRIDVSQMALAEEAGLAPVTLSRLESGRKKDPALGTLVCIAHALAWAGASVRADDVLVQLSAAFAGEIELPRDAVRWLRRRGKGFTEGEMPSIGHGS